MPEAELAVQPPSVGVGPLVQRDYWAVIDGCRCRPSEIAAIIAERFAHFPPQDLVAFERCKGEGILDVGDELDIRIRMAGEARVRVAHKDRCSITLATLAGHPEAGRITFGAYRNDAGDVIFHIRSRARASTAANYLGFLFAGDPMQTSTWTDFITSVAASCGSGVSGPINADTRHIDPADADAADESMDRPTFVAQGD